MRSRGFALVEVVAVAGTAVMGIAVAGPIVARVSPEAKRAVSLRNMQVIGAAGGAYRLDNDEYLPITLTYSPRGVGPGPGITQSGFCNWSAGGKNNDGWWATAAGGLRAYDVEAADRPLNAYAVPGVEFYAPAAPTTLPAAHPARLNEQAPVFKDPADEWSHQRRWPAPNPTKISLYDDVGSSYMWNALWWEQLTSIPDWPARMAEATRRLATGDRARPDRFVWMFDQIGDLIHQQGGPSRPTVLVLNLFIDGHAGHMPVKSKEYKTPNYTVVFE